MGRAGKRSRSRGGGGGGRRRGRSPGPSSASGGGSARRQRPWREALEEERARASCAHTVSASNLSPECSDRAIFDLFATAGKVVDIRLAWVSRAEAARVCRGFGFV